MEGVTKTVTEMHACLYTQRHYMYMYIEFVSYAYDYHVHKLCCVYFY